MSLQSHEEIVTSYESVSGPKDASQNGPISLATKSTWTFEDKKTNKRIQRETVVIIITSLDEGARKITQWTEVTRDL